MTIDGQRAPGTGLAPIAEDGFDREKVERGVRLILEGIGENLAREGLLETPRRVAQMYEEITAGLRRDPSAVLGRVFSESHDEMVMVRDISLYSICEHHLVPFFGKAHVAYVPNESGEITGLSKLARLVDELARRPQVQERLTRQIADELQAKLAPRGVLVVIEAEHMCMSMRGVRKPGAVTVTSAVLGDFRTRLSTRMEAMNLIGVTRLG